MVHLINHAVRRFVSTHRRKFLPVLLLSFALFAFSAADQPAGTKVWDFYTGYSIQSSPAIGQHGIVYFGTDSGKLYSFYPDGRGIWEYPTGDRIVGSPAIADDGTVIFGSTDGILYAVEPGGVEKWRFQANGPIASSPAIGPNGTIVFGTMVNRLFALRPDGSKLWDVESSSAIVGSPAISQHGVVYVAGADGTLAAISVKGDILWQFDAPNAILSSPAIGADGTVYFGCFDGHVYALSAVGKKLWTYATGGPVKSSPAVGPDGVIYVGSDDKLLYALAPDGFKKWTFSVGGAIRSTPAVAADGTVYVGSYDNALYAISSTGTKRWEFMTDEDVTSSPAIGADGTVFFGGWNGRFYAVKGTADLADGAWPRFRGNASQTGYRGSASVPEAKPATPAPPVDLTATNRVEPAKETQVVKRSADSWWDRVFGDKSKTAKNRGVLGGESKPPRQVAQAVEPKEKPKVIADARELMNMDSVAPTNPAPVTVVETPTVAVSAPTAPQPVVIEDAPTIAVATVPPAKPELLPMMTLVNTGGNSAITTVESSPIKTVTAPVVTNIPVTEPVKANVPVPVPPKAPAVETKPAITPAPAVETMKMINVTTPVPAKPVVQAPQPKVSVPPVAAMEKKPVVMPKKTPAAPATPVTPIPAVDERIPMMRLIESGDAKKTKTSSAIPETGVKTVTFGTTVTGMGTQTVVTEVVKADAGTTEISTKETTIVKSSPPAPKPVKPLSVSAQIREPRYVPGLIRSLVTGEKRRGLDPIPPQPDVGEVEIRERNYQPGFLQRLVRPGARPVAEPKVSAVETKSADEPKEETKIKVGGNSAVVEVRTIEIEPKKESPTVAAAVESKKPKKETKKEPKKESTAEKVAANVGEMRVISDSSELFPKGDTAEKATEKKSPPKVVDAPIAEVATVEIVEPVEVAVPDVASVSVEPVPPATPIVEEKIASMEKRVAAMAADLEESRRERDELKAVAEKAAAEKVAAEKVAAERKVASLTPKPEPKTTKSVEPEERILPPADPKTEQALSDVFGDKLSRLESHLISLNTELADARVERARLRKELAAARAGQKAAPAVVEVRGESAGSPAPTPKVAEPKVAKVEVATRPSDNVIPQPEWLKKEIRSVLAAAGEQWEQPPGAPAAIVPGPSVASSPGPPSVPVVSAPPANIQPVIPTPESSAIVAVETIEVNEPNSVAKPEADDSKAKKEEKARRPGFLSRLFGRRSAPEASRMTATNIVIVPPTVGDFPGAKPSDAQLLGTDNSFGLNLVPTNFPRIPYTPDKNAAFFQPGAGNLTQQPGFPRPQPQLISPPIRDLEPNLRPGPGLRDLNIEETVTLVGDKKGKQLPTPEFKPQVVIVSPPDNDRLTKPVLDLRGMVKSRRRVAEVLVSVGGGEFVPAAGIDSWSYQTPVARGMVLVRVKAVNVDGVESEIETRTYHHESRSRMTVKVLGQGDVSPALDQQELIVGQPYTVTAKPGAGQEFVGWSGAVTGREPTVSFVMNENLWLQAEFREKAPAIAAGRFTGLVHPRNEMSADRSGYIDLRVDGEGNYLGALQLAGKTHPLRGKFDGQWQAAESVEREGESAVAMALRLDRGNGGESLTGYFELGDEPLIVRAFRTLAAGGTLAVVRPGKYRMLMPAPAAGAEGPGGVGFGEATVAADGDVEFSFQLPDGTRLKQSTQLSAKGVWPLYVPLHGGRGALAGWIASTDEAKFSFYGEVRWLKPGGPGDARGFAVPRMIYGSPMSPSSANLSRDSSGSLVASR